MESGKDESKDADEDKDPKKDVDPEANNQVVLRNKGKSTESQRRALATRFYFLVFLTTLILGS